MDIRVVSRIDPASPDLDNQDFLLCVPRGWESYISREFYELQEGLVKRGWTKLVIDEVADSVILAAMSISSTVLLWEAYEFLERNFEMVSQRAGFTQPSQKRVVFCDDVHYFTPHRRAQRLRAFCWADMILATYPDKIAQWFPEVPNEKVKWTPHSAASYFQPSDERPSSNRILLSGSRTWPYPFRQFCHAKLSAAVCDVVDHPGYPGYPGDRTNDMRADPEVMMRLSGERYASLLRSYPAMLACGSIFGYLVAKVFEGMAAGCLVICERASLGERLAALGFVEGEHFIGTSLHHVIGDAEDARNAFVRNDPLLTRIVSNAATKVHEQHTTAVRAAQIHRYCTEGALNGI